jgi:hypothetical protein
MNNLKEYAGLLNEEAPENHFLAYITPGERDMLVAAGGKKTPTESGIFAYPPEGQYGGGGYSGGADANDGFGGSNNSGADANDGFATGGRTDSQTQYGNNPYSSTDNTSNRVQSYGYSDRIMGIPTGVTPTGQPFDQRSDLAKTGDAILDFVKGGGIIGGAFRTINNLAENFNKNRRNDFMSTADIKEYELGTGKNWNPNLVTNVNSDEYNYLKNETNYFDQSNSEENRDENDPSSFFDNPQDMASQNIINNPNPFSQVDNYFANLNNTNLGISDNFLNTYNEAKTKMANTLNMTPPNQQYGYGNNYNDTYSRQMNNSNVFYNYLNEQGLI